MPLLCSLAKPLDCFGKILLYTSTIGIPQTKVILCSGMSLLGCRTKPFVCFNHVCLGTIAIEITNPKIVLCLRNSLLCCSQINFSDLLGGEQNENS